MDWKKEQASDKHIARVTEIMRAKLKLTKDQKASELEPVRSLLRERKSLYLKDGVLHREGRNCGHKVAQLVLPDVYREIAFTGCHDEAGHQGRERTLSLMKSRFFWVGMEQYVADRVRQCPRCVRRKTPVRTAAELVPVETSYPLELVCMDFLSLEVSSGGYENVLVITDHFTRFAQAVPTRNQTAQTTARILFEHYICHYGFPSRLHSDQGRNFDGSVIKELCKLAGAAKSRTTPYHPQGDAMPERFNQTLMNMLGTLEQDQKSNWKAHVPALVHAYNATRHSSTGLTPHYLMFGRHPRLAIDAFLGLEPDREPGGKNMDSYVECLRKRLHTAYKVASKEARKQAQRHKQRYDLRVRLAQIEPGDRVLIRNVGLKGRQKLADRWDKDIFVVTGQPNPDIPVYWVQREHGRSEVKTLHRNMLLPISALPVTNQEAGRPRDTGTTSLPANLEANDSPQNTGNRMHGRWSKVQKERVHSEQDSAAPVRRYVIPQKRGEQLNPYAPEFKPRRSERLKGKR